MASGIENNPYAQSRALWDDLYGSVQLRLQNAYRVIAALALALVICMICLSMLSLKSTVKPYVALLRGDELITVKSFQSPESEAIKPQLAIQLAKQFILASRTVSLDEHINQQYHVQAYSYIAGSASDVLKSYLAARQLQHLQSAQVTTVLMKSPQVLDIRWQEDERNRATGELIRSSHYSAELTFSFQKPSHDLIVSEHNPFGFYITSLVWARDRVIQ